MTALVSSGIGAPWGMTVDSTGNVYFIDQTNKLVKKWTRATNAVTTLDFSASPFGAAGPSGIAVDGSGNVYVSDRANNVVKKWTAPSTVVTLDFTASPPLQPGQLALDSANNLYVADSGHNAVEKWTAPNVVATVDFSSSPNASVSGVAVDAGGDVYVSDQISGKVKERAIATGTVTTIVVIPQPGQLAVDGSGNVYVANPDANAITKWTAATQTAASLIASGLSGPLGVAVDADENVYVADSGNNRVLEKPRAFLDPTAKSETFAAGTDALPAVLPTDTNLLAPFAPTSDSLWLTVGTISSGVVNFNFALNASTSILNGHLTVLGVSIPVQQAADTPATIAINSGDNQSATVNTAFANPLQVIVKDAVNNPISGVTVIFAPPFSGPSCNLGVNVATTDSSGLAAAGPPFALTAAGTYHVTASAELSSAPFFTLTNLPGPATHLTVTPSTNSVTAGNSFSLTVTARDQYNNVATGYTGTAHFTSTDGGGSVVLPNSYTFVSGDNGVHTFTNGVTLVTAGSQSVTATDVGTSTITGNTGSIVVTPAAATHLAIGPQPSATATAGVAFATQPVVQLEDQFGNLIATDSTHTVTASRGSHGTASLQGSNLTVTLTPARPPSAACSTTKRRP